MGYRSDGLWVIRGPVQHVIAAWTALKLEMPPCPDNEDLWGLFKVFRVGGKGYIRFQYDGWKWYENFPDIQWLELLWNKLSENEHLSGKRVRLGEDADDNEETSFGEESWAIEIGYYRALTDEEPEEGDPLTMDVNELTDKEN